MLRKIVAVLVMSAALASCGKITSGKGCLNEDGKEAAIGIIRDQAGKLIEQIVDENGNRLLSASKIRAGLAQANMTLNDVRTTKSDPDSTKTFCTAKLKVAFPDNYVSDAQAFEELVESKLAINSNPEIERAANTFTIDFEYAVQPTDDGQKVYAEVEHGAPTYAMVSDIVGAHLALPLLRERYNANMRTKAARMEAEEASIREHNMASLAEARAENDVAVRTIGAVWSSIPDDQRQSILDMQRQWIRRKTAECKVAGAQTNGDETQRETARLKCEIRLTGERINYLRGYM